MKRTLSLLIALLAAAPCCGQFDDVPRTRLVRVAQEAYYRDTVTTPFLRDSLVRVQTTEQANASQWGSGGVIYSDDEYTVAVTNSHVIRTDTPRRSVIVHTESHNIECQVIYENPNYQQDGNDIAILMFRSPHDMCAIPLSDFDRPPAGTRVFSGGFPGGSPNVRPHAGQTTQINWNQGAIETTAGIVSGESGSPLVDDDGKLVAVMNASDGQTGFGVTSANVRGVVDTVLCRHRNPIIQRIGQRILRPFGVAQAAPTQYSAGQCINGQCPPQQIIRQSTAGRCNCPPGPPGKDGLPGERGADGLTGRDGKDGVDGRDGVDGLPGRDGKDGASTEVDYDRLADEVLARLPPFYPSWVDDKGEVIDEIKGGVRLGQSFPMRISVALKKAAADANP